MKPYYLLFLLLIFACKSSKSYTDNQLDISKEKIEKSDKEVKVSQLDLNTYEITFHTADPKEEVVITDEKGNTKKFSNVKSATLTKKTEQKKDSTAAEKKESTEKETDKSKIKGEKEVVSDAIQYKWIGLFLVIIVVCITVIWLINKFKK